MKYLLCFVLIVSLWSCNNKKKLEGQWTNSLLKYSYYNETRNVTISDDSVKFSYPYFEYWVSYPLEFEGKNILFDNFSFKTKIDRDTLILNDSIFFVKDPGDSLYGSAIITSIQLPKLNLPIKLKDQYKSSIIDHILYGKRLSNNQYGLQLNNKYAGLDDLGWFLSYGHNRAHNPFPISVLFIDRHSKMGEIEKILYEHQKVNFLKIKLVNNINLIYSDSIGLYYKYETLYKKLPPFSKDDYYFSTNSSQIPPPYPFLPFSHLEKDDSEISTIILKKNALYYKNEKISVNEFKSLAFRTIERNNIIISLFDLDSNYSKFLEMNAIIDNAYYESRNKMAIERFNADYNELEKEQILEIRNERKMKHIWSYSIPHYSYIVENNGTLFGLKVKPIDSLLPKMDSASGAE